MALTLDITNKKFGMLTAINKQTTWGRRTRWLFICDCGIKKVLDSAHVRYGRIVSCGCYLQSILSGNAKKHLAKYAGHNTSHGMSKTPIYAVWKTMHQRCKNPNCYDYQYYGAIGISVCESWNKFENFYNDMGSAPNDLTLDRINANGNYEKANCRWATWSEQNLNKRIKSK